MNFSFYFKRLIVPAIFTLILIASACKENPTTPTNTNSISGVLKDEQNIPVPNAIMEVTNGGAAIAGKIATDTTDEDGNYSLSNLPDDISTLNVTIKHPDFKPVESKLDKIIGSNKTNCIIKLEHEDSCCGRIEITVYKLSDSTPIYNAEFRLRRGSTLIRKAYTNESGKLVFEHVCLGDYNYRIAKDGFKVIEGELNVPSCDSAAAYRNSFYMATFNADSCCNGQITFTAKDSATNLPISGMEVRLWKGSQKLSVYNTNDAGQVIFKFICPGDYQISASNAHYKGIEFNFTMTCDDTVAYEKFFTKIASNNDSCCNGVIKVIPKDKNSGEILNGATVKLYQGDKLLLTKTVENGSAIFQHICPGDYSLDILMAHYKHLEFAISMTCNDTIETEKLLEPETTQDTCCNGRITFNVADSTTGNPLGNVLVKLYKAGTFLCQYTTGDNGQIIFEHICPGNYKIMGNKDGYNALAFEFTMGCNDIVTFNKKMLKVQSADTCCHGIINVNVTDSATGLPLSNVTVRLWHGSTKLGEYLTGDLGNVSFKNICPGEYSISGNKDGYKEISFTLTMVCNDNQSIAKTMSQVHINSDTCCNGQYKVIPRDKDSKDVLNGAIVTLYLGDKVIGTQTVENGYALFTKLCPGTYNFNITYTHYTHITFVDVLECNKAKELTEYMQKEGGVDTCYTAELDLKIMKDGTDQVIPGAKVDIYLHDQLIQTVYSNNEGWAKALNLMAPATYAVHISKDGYTTKIVNFTYTGCVVKSETIKLSPQ